MNSRSLLALAAGLALLFAACAVKPPVSLGKKESVVGQGMVITVTNTSDEHLHDVVVDIKSPAGDSRQLTMPTLGPHESVNVGWLKLDGWPIPEGSEVSVTAKGFAMPAAAKL